MRRVRAVTGFIFALCMCNVLLAGAARAEDGRVIVKYRSESAIQALGSDSVRMRTMRAQTGLDVVASRALIGRMHAVRATGVSSQELAARLAARSDVEYAVPDERRYIATTTPTDLLYAQQWYLQSTRASAINAQTAWDTTTGSSSVVVAVLDTGILPDHPDLASKLTNNGSTLYGYDFVSDAEVANDGDGRDADPSDTGDWVTTAESASGYFQGCKATNSTWHGSMVSGIIAAASNNAEGVAGVAWGARILPVRVLGKCGGYDSDIMAGMLWAAGLPVSGVDNNIYPAKIINMSLGGSGSCSAAYQDVVDQVQAAGSMVVAAAGNDSGSVGVPANCSGVLAVSALNSTGSKTFYSDFGPVAGIAAPGGDCGNAVSKATCEYPFYSTKNSGTMTPVTNDYSIASDAERGTSFSSPLVAGVAALMRSVNSSLTSATVIARLKSSATAFPAVAGLRSCTAVAFGTLENCNCTATTCGAGMLNAANAINEALRPVAAISSVTTASAGASISLGGTGSTAADGHTITSYLWTTDNGTMTNATQAGATLVTNSAGTVTVTLAVTDDAGKTDTASLSILVTAVVPGAPTIGTATAGSGQATVTFSAPAATGGASITSYTVISNPGSLTATGAASPITVTGLTNGTPYTFTVTATNTAGTGSASNASNSVTPMGNQAISTITFSPATLTIAGTITASATASSGLAVTFHSTTPTVCTVSGSTVTGVSLGTCTITATQAGNASYYAASTVNQNLTVGYNPAPPALTVSALSNGATTTETTQNISGTVTDVNGITSVTVNGAIAQGAADGSFSYPVQLVAGANTITVVATNKAGATTTDTRIITLNNSAPKLTVAYPPDNAVAIQQNITVTGTIADLLASATTTAKTAATASAMTVNYSVNGGASQAASLTDGTYAFTATLVSGMNTIRITATNSSGTTVEAKRTVSYQSVAFSLAITDPATDVHLALGSYLLSGTVADNTTTVGVTIAMDGISYTPTVTNGVFQQQLSFAAGKTYQISVTGIDQNNNSLTVQRNIIREAASSFTLAEALLALQVSVGMSTPPSAQILRMDVAPMVNGVSVGDGKVDIEDALVILRMAVGLIQ